MTVMNWYQRDFEQGFFLVPVPGQGLYILPVYFKSWYTIKEEEKAVVPGAQDSQNRSGICRVAHAATTNPPTGPTSTASLSHLNQLLWFEGVRT